MKLMKKVIFVIILVIFTTTANADCGDPTIQAVCKITLKNGQIRQGFITLGYGGYYGIWTNGFYFEQGENYKHPILFSLDFKSITETKENSYDVIAGEENHICFDRNLKFYFMQWVETPSIYNPKKIELSSEKNFEYVTVTTNLEKKYKLLDSLTLFLELPSTTYLSLKENVSKVKIALSDIKEFELVSNPSVELIEEIKTKTKKAFEINNGPESSGDFIAADWYHDILTNKILYKRYQTMIEFNNKR